MVNQVKSVCHLSSKLCSLTLDPAGGLSRLHRQHTLCAQLTLGTCCAGIGAAMTVIRSPLAAVCVSCNPTRQMIASGKGGKRSFSKFYCVLLGCGSHKQQLVYLWRPEQHTFDQMCLVEPDLCMLTQLRPWHCTCGICSSSMQMSVLQARCPAALSTRTIQSSLLS